MLLLANHILLNFVRDLIFCVFVGHKTWILHRDVSVHNVLVGKPNAEPGNRGVLVDLDMVIRLGTETLVDFRTVSASYF